MATRNHHSLAQRTAYSAPGGISQVPPVSDLKVSSAGSPAGSPPRSNGVSAGSEAPQVNLPAIQQFLLGAPPSPIFPPRVISKSQTAPNDGAELEPQRSGWTPRIISFGGPIPSAKSTSHVTESAPAPTIDCKHGEVQSAFPGSRDIPTKVLTGAQDPLEDSTEMSDSKRFKGRSLKAAGKASSRVRTIQEPV